MVQMIQNFSIGQRLVGRRESREMEREMERDLEREKERKMERKLEREMKLMRIVALLLLVFLVFLVRHNWWKQIEYYFSERESKDDIWLELELNQK